MKSVSVIFVRYLAAFVFCFFVVSASAWGQGEDGSGPGSSPILPEINDLAQQEVEQRLRAYGNDMMGDQIDPATGTLIFSQTDVSIPGNFRLPVAITRKLTGKDLQADASSFFASWTLDIPHVSQIVTTYVDGIASKGINNWNNRCSGSTDPFTAMNGMFVSDEITDGMSVNIPGSSSGRVLDNPAESTSIWGDRSTPVKSTTGHL